eukprot:CAMPEP_0176327186 /NCGR_PEP_ID=MMETSP0121_2-20121125/74318_1 /TAXON_ID=160619 /ORGANISM="Kryptoperidinium foliaceum, Strain CCMP 1326" /LENGTH=46 /DNA_ID= /DNA_START= /DNA_END= /DNA_ORIENTATION=
MSRKAALLDAVSTSWAMSYLALWPENTQTQLGMLSNIPVLPTNPYA